MAGGDIPIEILKDIRDDIRGLRSGVHGDSSAAGVTGSP